MSAYQTKPTNQNSNDDMDDDGSDPGLSSSSYSDRIPYLDTQVFLSGLRSFGDKFTNHLLAKTGYDEHLSTLQKLEAVEAGLAHNRGNAERSEMACRTPKHANELSRLVCFIVEIISAKRRFSIIGKTRYSANLFDWIDPIEREDIRGESSPVNHIIDNQTALTTLLLYSLMPPSLIVKHFR
jgi:hypothetical protein